MKQISSVGRYCCRALARSRREVARVFCLDQLSVSRRSVAPILCQAVAFFGLTCVSVADEGAESTPALRVLDSPGEACHYLLLSREVEDASVEAFDHSHSLLLSSYSLNGGGFVSATAGAGIVLPSAVSPSVYSACSYMPGGEIECFAYVGSLGGGYHTRLFKLSGSSDGLPPVSFFADFSRVSIPPVLDGGGSGAFIHDARGAGFFSRAGTPFMYGEGILSGAEEAVSALQVWEFPVLHEIEAAASQEVMNGMASPFVPSATLVGAGASPRHSFWGESVVIAARDTESEGDLGMRYPLIAYRSIGATGWLPLDLGAQALQTPTDYQMRIIGQYMYVAWPEKSLPLGFTVLRLCLEPEGGASMSEAPGWQALSSFSAGPASVTLGAGVDGAIEASDQPCVLSIICSPGAELPKIAVSRSADSGIVEIYDLAVPTD